MLEGQGVGFWKLGRVKTLMEDENYRNFVVSRLNSTLDRKLSAEDMHLEDVVRFSFLFSIVQKIALQHGDRQTLQIFPRLLISVCNFAFSFRRLLPNLCSKGC